jgi:hypothetical protein
MSLPNGPLRFQVILSKEIAAQVKGLLQEAADMDLRDAFINALQAIDARLKADPDVFGEPRYTLKNLGLQVRIAIILPCTVTYAVNMQARRVFIAGIQFYPPA